MSWHCSQVEVEEFSRLGCLDGAQSALLKSTRIAERSSFGDKKKVTSNPSPSGMTYDPSTAKRGVESWILSLRDSRASRSASPGSAQEKTTTATSGPRPSGLFARWSPDSRSWKTYRGFSARYKTKKQARLKQAISGRFLGTWPRAGMTHGGVCFRLQSWERRICERGCGSLPTPSATSYGTNQGGAAGRVGKVRPSLETMAERDQWPTPTQRDYRSDKRTEIGAAKRAESKRGIMLPESVGGLLNPTWVEWLMGFPIGWTALKPLGTDKFRRWLDSHGAF